MRVLQGSIRRGVVVTGIVLALALGAWLVVGAPSQSAQAAAAAVSTSAPIAHSFVGRGDEGQQVHIDIRDVTLTTTPGIGIDVGSVRLTNPASGNVGTEPVFVAGEGEWSVSPQGTVTFSPLPGFSGFSQPVEYVVNDEAGTTSAPALLSVAYPGVDDVVVSVAPGALLTFPVATGPATAHDSIVLIDPVSGDEVQEFEIEGEGVWAVDVAQSAVLFRAHAGFTGPTSPLAYTAYDAEGHRALPAVIRVVVDEQSPSPISPSDGSEHVSTAYLTNVDIDPFANFLPDPASITADSATFVFLEADGVELAARAREAVTPDGSFVFDAQRALVRFSPVDGFTGDTLAVPYAFTDSTGVVHTSAMQVTVVAPVLGAEGVEPTSTERAQPTAVSARPMASLGDHGVRATAVSTLPATGRGVPAQALLASLLLTGAGGLIVVVSNLRASRRRT